jgi:tRNA (guanine37-N1)-methyltransferase
MKIHVLTLFPEVFEAVFRSSMMWYAHEIGAVTTSVVNFRDYSTNKHKKVDDYAFGGGPGMLLQVEPIHRAIQSIEGYETARKILLSPQGVPYTQEKAKALAKEEQLILICGHYEGFDDRIRHFVDEEISIGDYVMTGGEIGAMAIADSVIRLLPGVLASEAAFQDESFYDGLLEYPQYTRPKEYLGHVVPDVLLSGNHAEIRKWRLEESLKRTRERRPDLLQKRDKKD